MSKVTTDVQPARFNPRLDLLMELQGYLTAAMARDNNQDFAKYDAAVTRGVRALRLSAQEVEGLLDTVNGLMMPLLREWGARKEGRESVLRKGGLSLIRGGRHVSSSQITRGEDNVR